MVPAELDTVAKASERRKICDRWAETHDLCYLVTTCCIWLGAVGVLWSIFEESIVGILLNATFVLIADHVRGLHRDQAILWRVLKGFM